MTTIQAIALVAAAATLLIVLIASAIVKKAKRWLRVRKHNKCWNNPDYRRKWMQRYIAETESL